MNIAACPFCGSCILHITENLNQWPTSVFIRCSSCRASGPIVYKNMHADYKDCCDRAMTLWNNSTFSEAVPVEDPEMKL